MSTEISEYDRFDYDYKDYWQGREYENRAEFIALKKLTRKLSGKFFLDIGGSFGRLTPLYADRFQFPIILDYSLKTLLKYEKELKEHFPNITLIAANVYQLPFKDRSVDGAMMVRVLHHIQEPDRYFNQVSRVIKDQGGYIQEFANKLHLKAAIKWLLSGKWSNFSQEAYQQEVKDPTGAESSGTIFLNFHPAFIRERLWMKGFTLVRRVNCSFLRVPFLKRVLPIRLILFLEKILQSVGSFIALTPSVIYLFRKDDNGDSYNAESVEEILCCPKCRGQLTFSENSAVCSQCKAQYRRESSVWDLRAK